MADDDREVGRRVMVAMLETVKFNIAALDAAAKG